MKTLLHIHYLLAALLTCLSTSLFAHIVLEEKNAPASTSYKAVLRVGHGCEGSATTSLIVQLPSGFKGAKPMPKAGWTLAIQSGKLSTPYISHGKPITEDVTEIRWTANSQDSWLQDTYYDEFILHGTLPDTPGPLWFKVRQICEKGRNDWVEIPASGTSTQGLKMPAALLEVLPAKSPEHPH